MNKFVANIRGRLLGGPVMRYYKLQAAYSIATELLPALDLEDCLKILVNRIASYMGVEIVSIMFMDSDKRRLIVKIAKGLDQQVVRDASSQIGEGVAGWVGKTGEPLLIRDITRDSRFVARPTGKYYNNSLLTVPLKLRSRVIGVINVNNKVSRDIFRESDLELLRTIADFAAITIETIRLEEQVKRIDKENREMISNVAHELKTPLATVKEAITLILDGLSGEINEKQKKYLELSTQNVGRMVNIINELLSANRISAGNGAHMKRNLFNITDSTRSILDSLGLVAHEKGVLLKGMIPDKRIEIWGDPDKLNEVISNLVDNAIKYNKPEGRVEVSLEEDERSVLISVRDNGRGIPKEDINRIFERYYRVGGGTDNSIPGTGLGLSIVKDIVNMHKGNISVESDSGKGTMFTVRLPKDLRG